MTTIGSAFVQVRADVSRFAGEAADGVKKAGPVVKAGVDKAMSFGKIAGAALAGITAYGTKSAATLENTTTAFTSLLGSSQAAQTQIAALQKFAAATPFSQQDVLHYAQQFYAMSDSIGMAKSQVIPFETAIGNIGAVTGASSENISAAMTAIAQMGSAGKITSGDIRQLSDNLPGFNGVAAIARAQGKSTAQVMDEISSGTLNAKDGVAALVKGMQSFPGAAGAMQKQSMTLNGLWSTFTDTAKINLTNALSQSIPIMKQTLDQVTPIVGKATTALAPVLANLVKQIAPLVGPLVGILAQVLTTFATVIGPVFKQLLPVLKPVGDALIAMINAASPIFDLLETLAQTLIPPLSKVVIVLAGVIGQVASAMSDLLGPILPVIGSLIAALAPVISMIGTVLVGVMEALQPLIAALSGAFMRILQALRPQLPQIVAAIAQLAQAMVRVLIALMPLIPPLTSIILLLVRIGGPVLSAVITAVANVVGWFGNLVGWVVHLGSTWNTIFRNVIHPVIAAFMTAGKLLWNYYYKPILTALVKSFKAVGSAFSWVWRSVISPVVNAFGSAISWVWNRVISPVFHAISNGWRTLVGGIQSVAGGLANAISSAVSGIWDIVKTPINWVIEAMNFIIKGLDSISFTLPSWVPFVGGKHFGVDIPLIPEFRAAGGPVTAGKPYIVGELGMEMFVPNQSGQIVDAARTARAMSSTPDDLAAAVHAENERLLQQIAQLTAAVAAVASRDNVLVVDSREIARASTTGGLRMGRAL